MAPFFEDTNRIFTKEFITRKDFVGNPSAVPIFIVGMPRSGSTLTEQIISAHPKIFRAGEIKNLSYSIAASAEIPQPPKFPAMAEVLRPSHLNTIAKNYFTAITKISNNAERCDGQLLTNFFFADSFNDASERKDRAHHAQPGRLLLSTWTKLFKDDMPTVTTWANSAAITSVIADLRDHWREVLTASAFLEVNTRRRARSETNARRVMISGAASGIAVPEVPRVRPPGENRERVEGPQADLQNVGERGPPLRGQAHPLIEALGLPIEDGPKRQPAPARRIERRASKIALLAVGGSAFLLFSAAAAVPDRPWRGYGRAPRTVNRAMRAREQGAMAS